MEMYEDDWLNERSVTTRDQRKLADYIGQHLLDNPFCAKNYSDEKFTILLFGRSSFHLSVLEAVYIKSCKLNLCSQKKFVYNVKLLR